MTQVNANGNTYSDDGSTEKDMVVNGGYRTWFFKMVGDVMMDIAAKLSTLAAAVAAAAASAASAVSSPGTSATSTTSITVGYGVKSFTLQAGKSIPPGVPLMIAKIGAASTVWMHAIVESYNSATGATVGTVIALSGLGTVAANWSVGLCGPGGAGLGFNQYTGSQFYAAGIFEGAVDIAAGNTADLSTGTLFQKIATANWTLAVTGIPAGAAACFILELTNGGAWTFTPPAGTTYARGVTPVLSASGTDVLALYKFPSGNWRLLLLAQGAA
jgi:hypothetical protein